MSNTTKNLIEDLFNRQERQDKEVNELKHLNQRFQDSEKGKQAKEVAFGDKLDGLKNQFSSFFNRKPTEVQGAL